MPWTPRRRLRAALQDAALRYAQEFGWEVLPGTYLRRGLSARCSCGDPDCPAPGLHPAGPGPGAAAIEPTSDPSVIRWWWSHRPDANVLLPTGRSFDVIDVPEAPGVRAIARLRRMDVHFGPVVRTPARRVQFLVAPGAAAELPAQLRRLGWGATRLDLLCHGDGGAILAPPSRYGDRGLVRWVRVPVHSDTGDARLPHARLLIAAISRECARPVGYGEPPTIRSGETPDEPPSHGDEPSSDGAT